MSLLLLNKKKRYEKCQSLRESVIFPRAPPLALAFAVTSKRLWKQIAPAARCNANEPEGGLSDHVSPAVYERVKFWC